MHIYSGAMTFAMHLLYFPVNALSTGNASDCEQWLPEVEFLGGCMIIHSRATHTGIPTFRKPLKTIADKLLRFGGCARNPQGLSGLLPAIQQPARQLNCSMCAWTTFNFTISLFWRTTPLSVKETDDLIGVVPSHASSRATIARKRMMRL